MLNVIKDMIESKLFNRTRNSQASNKGSANKGDSNVTTTSALQTIPAVSKQDLVVFHPS